MSYMNKIMASSKPSALKKAKGQKLDESKIDPSEEALARRNAILDKVDAADGKTSRSALTKKKGPCWKGYEMVGMKKKGGRKVPNCVPLKK
jgi:hypothetical protein